MMVEVRIVVILMGKRKKRMAGRGQRWKTYDVTSCLNFSLSVFTL